MDTRKWNPENGLQKMDSRKWILENGVQKMDSRKWSPEDWLQKMNSRNLTPENGLQKLDSRKWTPQNDPRNRWRTPHATWAPWRLWNGTWFNSKRHLTLELQMYSYITTKGPRTGPKERSLNSIGITPVRGHVCMVIKKDRTSRDRLATTTRNVLQVRA